MPLDQKKLEGEFRKVLDTPQDTFLKAGAAWANAYGKYARDAVSCSGLTALPPGLAAAQTLLKTSMTAAFKSSKDPSAWVQRVGLALALFWTAPPIVFAGVPPGPVTIPTPALQAAFVGGLLPVLVKNFSRTAAGQVIGTKEAAADLAKAIHTITTTIPVVHALPLACAGPIS